jgi:hypothetical protein
MVPFEELQALWQNQPQPSIDAAAAARLTRGLNAYRRRQLSVYSVKLLLVTGLIVWMAARGHSSAPSVAAVVLLGTVAGALLYIDWRAQRALARLDFSGASLEFIRHAIAELERQREPFRKYYWPFLGSLVLAENLCFAWLHAPNLWARAGWHIFATLAPFAGYELGRRVRFKRFEAECLPLIAQLRAVEQSLEEREK